MSTSPYITETVTDVKHWNDTLFSFRTTRAKSFRFVNGQFVMIGLEVEGKPLTRAYSIASANHEEFLEFFSIKVQDGKLTSRLQHLQVGDSIYVSRKPTGTLVLRDLKPGKRLFLFATGTGLAPFMSLVHDPEMYENFEQIILMHGVRWVNELAYKDYLEQVLPQHELLGDWVREKLIYYPAVTREPFIHHGRLTHLIQSGELFKHIHQAPLNPELDRAMICGSPAMLEDISHMLDSYGFNMSPRQGEQGDYVIERAFVDK
ncbi:MAG: ferredoxin--NADP reductase [Thiofilum sp.]|uniref:ferredoxin--NADP reductase n=1 Tax=Thiofilum sp. TaxID=2212733 RepID=UPI0025F21DEF|nr:ferredoxin--NADP reductase [Thiofilum sp.]MBK8454139.1 ferredoxin--NADP reductase [Thiofilum sp.]